jgi:hypothetical protein
MYTCVLTEVNRLISLCMATFSPVFWNYDSDFTLKPIVLWFAELELCLQYECCFTKSFWGHINVVLETSVLETCLSLSLGLAWNVVLLTIFDMTNLHRKVFGVSWTLHILQEWFVFIVQEKIILYINVDIKHGSLFQGSYIFVIRNAKKWKLMCHHVCYLWSPSFSPLSENAVE